METKLFTLAALATASIAAFATPPDSRPLPGSERGVVLSSTPVFQRQQIITPHQTCFTEQVAVSNGQQNNTAGAVLGAILGAGVGTQIGGGTGKVAATAAGSVIGAEIGRNSSSGTQMRDVQRCTTENLVEYHDAVVGFNVVYEYAGIQYRAQLARDPGSTIALRVVPASQ